MYLDIIINFILFCLFQESYTYKDPITEFVECLYVNFDFDSAQKKLRECESVSMPLSNLPTFINNFNIFFPTNCKEVGPGLLALRDNIEVF